jgi:ferredoxin-NADP reductase
MLLRLRSITWLTPSINAYELVDPEGCDLPPFAAGAHITVALGEALRDYSLWSDPAERRRYGIAVLREKEGSGSRHIHEAVRVGELIRASRPRNDFRLEGAATRHLLLAGGIGITPIMAMLAELRRREADFTLHYCTRSAEETAFLDELSLLAALGRVRFHHDGGDPAHGLDIARLLQQHEPGTHLYYCGPAGLMAAARAATAHWPPDHVHCEHFKGPGAARPEL